MPALKYLPDVVVTLHRSKVPAADIGRYEAHCLALSQPCLTLPCPYCYLDGAQKDMTTVRSDPGAQQLRCQACHHEFDVTETAR